MQGYGVGDVVFYKTFSGSWRAVFVKAKEDEIKNDQSGFSGKVIDAGEMSDVGLSVWGYDSQIYRVQLIESLLNRKGW